MTFGQSLVAHWYYHVPDLLLVALSGLLLARLALHLVGLGESGGGTVGRLLAIATSPAMKPVAFITPRVVPGWLVIVLAMVWLLTLRMALFVIVSATGARLSLLDALGSA